LINSRPNSGSISGLLAARLVAATDWLAQQPETRELGQGYFGASTGAAAALIAAAERADIVRAVVSRGGRPDLAGDALARVRAPTLLIVGGKDEVVIQLNKAALQRLRTEKRLEIVPGATHLLKRLARSRRLRVWRATGSCANLRTRRVALRLMRQALGTTCELSFQSFRRSGPCGASLHQTGS
jgi:dienelactone hydrolase